MNDIIPSLTETTAQSLPEPAVHAASPETLMPQHSPTLPETLVLDDHPASAPSNLDQLLNHGSYRVKEEHALIQRRTVETSQVALQPSPNPYELSVFSPPAAANALCRRHRTGKVARLPKLERDLVNKLLHNHVPYSKIVWALSERDITVTERNISNWRTRGGYQDWCAEQENQVRLAHVQDHLTDYLRKHDAQQLPEVGLQVAATQLTSLLLNPHTSAPLLADPAKYAKIVAMLDQCSVRLAELQTERYDTLRRSHIKDTTPNLRWKEEESVEGLRQIASAAKLGKSAYEEDVPHRNDLPPREEMPRHESQTFGDMILKTLAARSNKAPSTTDSGNSQ